MTFENKFRNFVGRIESLSKEEIVILSRSLLEEYNNERKVVIDSWKGKSSFSFKEVGDNIIVTKYQRPEKGAEPKAVRTEISLEELRDIENVIFFLTREVGKDFIKSPTVAENVYNLPWKEIFSDRKRHNKFTIILNVLDKKGVIEYRGGVIYLK